MAEKMNVNFRALRAEVTKFYRVCKRQNQTGSDILRRMMREYTAGNITFTMNRGAKDES